VKSILLTGCAGFIGSNFVPYFLNKETGIIDMDEVEKIALKEKPKMILA
jgi:glycine/serine hydroxymethyltransferase